MRIVIDFLGAQTASRFRGIGRYTDSLVQALVRLKGEHEVILVLNDAFADTILPIRRRFAPILPARNIRVWTAPEGTAEGGKKGKRHRQQAEAIRESFIASLNPDVILITTLFEGHQPGFAASVHAMGFGIPTAVICYDFIPLHFPDIYLDPDPAWKARYHQTLEMLGKADLLLAISDFTAEEARARFPGDARVITAISAGRDGIFAPVITSDGERAAFLARHGIARRYIVTSGGNEPRKNLTLLFDAFARMPAPSRGGFQIVVSGDQSADAVRALRAKAAASGLQADELVVLGHLPDADLLTLYNEAQLMVFPSRAEGFGLPPLEAMACGTPSIASNASSLPEVMGLTEAMFDPDDPDALATLMAEALTDGPLRKRLIANCAQRAAVFSWERTAQLALDAMTALVAQKAAPLDRIDPLERCVKAIAETAEAQEFDDLARRLAVNFPAKGADRRIFVDISELAQHDARTGCQRVTRSVLNQWLSQPPEGAEIIPVYATNGYSDFFHAHAYAAKLTGKPAPGPDLPVDFAPGDIFFGLDLNPGIGPAQVAALSRMQRFGVRILFLVYDLLPLELPEFFVPGAREGHGAWVDVATRFDGVICISQATADAVRRWRDEHHGPGAPFEYHAVHLGADIESSVPTTGMPGDAPQILSAIAAKQSFLMTGTLEPRKGHAHALDAFDLLWQQGRDVALVIVGKKGWLVEPLAKRITGHPEFGTRLFWLEGISDAYLQAVYDKATCLLAASWGEGFGLPLIEAARQGLPILARDLPVFREVAGPHATYFDSQSAAGLAEAVVTWLADHAAGRAPGSADMPYATWAECAQKMADILLQRPE